MSTTLTAPGVYVQEVPSGVRTITGVATSIAAFVGTAPRGPTDRATRIDSFGDYARSFGGLDLGSPMSYSVKQYFDNGGGTAYIIRVVNGAAHARIELETAGEAPNDKLTLEATNPGAWGNRLRASVDHKTKPGAGEAFNLTVQELDEDDQVVSTEKFFNLAVSEDDPMFVARALRQGSRLVRVPRNDEGAWIVPNVRPNATDDAIDAVDDSGSDGDPVTDAQVVGDEDAKTGINALIPVDIFNLLVLPPLPGAATATDDMYQAGLTLCVRRRAMLLVDAGNSAASEVPAEVSALGLGSPPNTRNAVVYYPMLVMTDPLRGGTSVFPPSGAIAGVIARTDSARGVWKAPAGTEAGVTGALDVSQPVGLAESGQLNPLGINCLRVIQPFGRVVWGARTLAGADQLADDYKYLPVRRLALFIEESLFRGTQWVVFEPNDEPLWSQIRLNVGAFMQGLFRQGAFQGKTPNEAYFVKCDKETTPQADINLGIVNIVVGFAPLKPAEFVVIKIQQIAGQIQT
jgi:uncharacterized protein